MFYSIQASLFYTVMYLKGVLLYLANDILNEKFQKKCSLVQEPLQYHIFCLRTPQKISTMYFLMCLPFIFGLFFCITGKYHLTAQMK